MKNLDLVDIEEDSKFVVKYLKQLIFNGFLDMADQVMMYIDYLVDKHEKISNSDKEQSFYIFLRSITTSAIEDIRIVYGSTVRPVSNSNTSYHFQPS
jgi:hypothetical protein